MEDKELTVSIFNYTDKLSMDVMVDLIESKSSLSHFDYDFELKEKIYSTSVDIVMAELKAFALEYANA